MANELKRVFYNNVEAFLLREPSLREPASSYFFEDDDGLYTSFVAFTFPGGFIKIKTGKLHECANTVFPSGVEYTIRTRGTTDYGRCSGVGVFHITSPQAQPHDKVYRTGQVNGRVDL